MRLSFVVAGRNDNYGENFDDRLIRAYTINLYNYRDSELIFVEWNPIRNKPLVSDKIKNLWGDRVNCYIVDGAYERFGGNRPFAEFVAKNVGIRRARGEFILATNAEVVLNPNIDLNSLKEGVCYRAIKITIPDDYRNITFPIPRSKIIWQQQKIALSHSGDFTLLDRNSWFRLRGYNESYKHMHTWKDDMLVERCILNGYAIEFLGEIAHWEHPIGSQHLMRNRNQYNENKINTHNWGLGCAVEKRDKYHTWLHAKFF